MLALTVSSAMMRRARERTHSAQAISAPERPQAAAPPSSAGPMKGGNAEMRVKFEAMIRKAQDDICSAIERADGTQFREDSWTRAGGGGGTTRVLSQGNVWEKAGVAVSVVHGEMPPEALRAATGDPTLKVGTGGNVPFFAAGISSVMHPWNPYAPTMHFNYRYFETQAQPGADGAAPMWWFGGGTDITPAYLFPEDLRHFHGTYKAVCDRHDPSYYAKYKAWADEYYLIKHRGERRGCGGIFFDNKNDKDPEAIFRFAQDCAAAVVPAYAPLVNKHKNDPYNNRQKQWQQLRRGRYVEFNVIYDRGTTFGLQTGGRVESILMSLPLTARWEYDMRPKAGTPEADLLDACRNPREWV